MCPDPEPQPVAGHVPQPLPLLCFMRVDLGEWEELVHLIPGSLERGPTGGDSRGGVMTSSGPGYMSKQSWTNEQMNVVHHL